MSSVEDAFGGEFYEKFVEARRNSQIQRLKLTSDLKAKIINMAKADLKPESPSLDFLHNNTIYHVILAEAPAQLNIRELKFGKALSFRWKGLWVSAVLSDEDLEKIEPNQAYLLVGYLKQKDSADGRRFYNFNCHGVITMDEVIEQQNQSETDQEITNKALEN